MGAAYPVTRRGMAGAAAVVLAVGVAGWASPALAGPDLPVSVTVEVELMSRSISVGETVGGVFLENETTADTSRLLVTLAVSPVPPLALYLIGGASSLDLDEFGFNSDFNGIYGGGGTLTLEDVLAPGTALFLDGRYLRFEADDRVLVDTGVVVVAPETITWNEVRSRLGVIGRRYRVEPYGGVELSWAWGDDRFGPPVNATFEFGQENVVGLFGGLRFLLGPAQRSIGFVEFSMLDVYAVNMGLTVGF